MRECVRERERRWGWIERYRLKCGLNGKYRKGPTRAEEFLGVDDTFYQQLSITDPDVTSDHHCSATFVNHHVTYLNLHTFVGIPHGCLSLFGPTVFSRWGMLSAFDGCSKSQLHGWQALKMNLLLKK